MPLIPQVDKSRKDGPINGDGRTSDDGIVSHNILNKITKWLNLISWIGGPLAGVLMFFAQNGWNFNINDKSISALLWSLLAYMLGHQIIQMAVEVKTRRDSRLLHEEVISRISSFENSMIGHMSGFNVSLVRESDISDRITASTMFAKTVVNTFVKISHLTGTQQRTSHDIIVDRYQSFLKKGPDVVWHDIAGIGDFLNGRYTSIFKDGDNTPLGTHKLHLLNSNTPIINFLMCAPNDSDFSDLYFGWISNSSKTMVDIFHTKDHRIINLFNNYFMQLLSGHNIIDVDIPYTVRGDQRFTNSAVQNLPGNWLSFSVSTSRSKKEVSDRMDYADVHIDYTDRWHIQGRIFRNDAHVETFESEHCFLLERTLYYKFISRDAKGMTIKVGIGGYTIEPTLGQHHLTGFYTTFGNNRSSMSHMSAYKLMRQDRVNKAFVREMYDRYYVLPEK